MDAEIEDFIPVYPRQTDPDIQIKVAAKKEFRDFAAATSEKPPERASLFAHQRLFERIMRVYDRMLLISEPGTGKTLSYLAATEYLKAHSMYKRAYIIGPGPTVLADARRQLVCKAAPFGVYETRAIDTARNARSRENLLTRVIKGFYTFESYKKFANTLAKKSDKEVESEYSGCIFIVDEAHNITNQDSKHTSLYYSFERVFSIARRTKIILTTATPMVNRVDEIGTLMNLILPEERKFPPDFDFEGITGEDVVSRCKGFVSYVRSEGLLASSEYIGVQANERGIGESLPDQARPVIFETPMGDLQEAAYANFFSKTLVDGKKLENAFFRNPLQISAFVFPDGSFGGIVDGSVPSDAIESETFSPNEGIAKYVERLKNGDYDFKRDRGATAAFAKWKHSGGARTFKDWIAGVGRPEGTPPTHNLARISCKAARIIEIENAAGPGSGTSFVYSETKNGGGAVMLAMCFKAFGYARFLPKPSQTEVSEDEDRLEAMDPYCATSKGGRESEDLDLVLGKRPRYALLTAKDLSKHQKDEIFRVFNSPQNVNGEYIKVLIGSKITRDGINLHHVERVHIFIPQFTVSGMIQAVARAMRATSHNELFEMRKKKLLESGVQKSEEELNNAARITVSIYLHSAKPSPKQMYTDANIYSLAAAKDFSIRQVMRMLKMSAIDCILNKSRNVTVPFARGQISDNSPACDYSACAYPCGGISLPPLSEIPVDYSTFDLLFLNAEIAGAMESLYLNEFLESPSEPVVLTTACGSYRQMAVFSAVDKLINSQQRLKNVFGQICYVDILEDGRAFLSNDLLRTQHSAMNGPRGTSPLFASYSLEPIYTSRRPLSLSYMFSRESIMEDYRNEQISNFNAYNRIVMIPTFAGRISLVEEIVSSLVIGILPKFRKDILKTLIDDDSVLSLFYITTVGTLRKLYEKTINEAQPSELVCIDASLKNAIYEISPESPDNATIVFHREYEAQGQEVLGQYAVTQKSASKLDDAFRVFIPLEGTHLRWRYAYPFAEARSIDKLRKMDPSDEFPFTKLDRFFTRMLGVAATSDNILAAVAKRVSIQLENQDLSDDLSPKESSALYGITSGGSSFRIVDQRIKASSRGRVCKNIDSLTLLSVIFDLNPSATAEDVIADQPSRKEAEEAKLEAVREKALSFSRLRDIFKNSPAALKRVVGFGTEEWMRRASDIQALTHASLCHYIESEMDKRGLIKENL
jgi:hypothetical protein